MRNYVSFFGDGVTLVQYKTCKHLVQNKSLR